MQSYSGKQIADVRFAQAHGLREWERLTGESFGIGKYIQIGVVKNV